MADEQNAQKFVFYRSVGFNECLFSRWSVFYCLDSLTISFERTRCRRPENGWGLHNFTLSTHGTAMQLNVKRIACFLSPFCSPVALEWLLNHRFGKRGLSIRANLIKTSFPFLVDSLDER